MSAPQGAGSVIAICVTDAPFFPSQCKALARRVTLGLARTGMTGSHSSGDIFLAISTANEGAFSPKTPKNPENNTAYGHLAFIPWDAIDPFSTAVVQATEEAVANALVANEDMTGRDGHRSPALPRHRLAEILSLPGKDRQIGLTGLFRWTPRDQSAPLVSALEDRCGLPAAIATPLTAPAAGV